MFQLFISLIVVLISKKLSLYLKNIFSKMLCFSLRLSISFFIPLIIANMLILWFHSDYSTTYLLTWYLILSVSMASSITLSIMLAPSLEVHFQVLIMIFNQINFSSPLPSCPELVCMFVDFLSQCSKRVWLLLLFLISWTMLPFWDSSFMTELVLANS